MLRPLGPLQVVVGLLQLSDVFVKLVSNGGGLSQVSLQAGDLPVGLRVLRLILLLAGGPPQSQEGTGK